MHLPQRRMRIDRERKRSRPPYFERASANGGTARTISVSRFCNENLRIKPVRPRGDNVHCAYD